MITWFLPNSGAAWVISLVLVSFSFLFFLISYASFCCLTKKWLLENSTLMLQTTPASCYAIPVSSCRRKQAFSTRCWEFGCVALISDVGDQSRLLPTRPAVHILCLLLALCWSLYAAGQTGVSQALLFTLDTYLVSPVLVCYTTTCSWLLCPHTGPVVGCCVRFYCRLEQSLWLNVSFSFSSN